MSRLAERNVDRVSAIKEWHSGPSTHTELAPYLHERIMIRHDLQPRLGCLDRLLAIAGSDVDPREIRVVIAVVELEIERALAQIDGGFVLPLDECQGEPEK